MNREDVIRWMQEVGAKESNPTPQNYEGFVDIFQHFAALVATAEREACARVCEQPSDEIQITDDISQRIYKDAFDCAEAIRARGE